MVMNKMKKPNTDLYWMIGFVMILLMFALFMFGDGTIVVGCPTPII